MTHLNLTNQKLWIQMASGTAVDLLDPDPQTIMIDDIANHLSRLCRYTGAPPFHYSVAQHSVLVAQQLPAELQLQGLLHDAAEAYVGDVNRPLKMAMRILSGQEMTPYDEIEALIDYVIAKRFMLERPLPKAVKIIDNRMLVTEARDLGFLRVAPRPWGLKYEPYSFTIQCQTAERARDEFLKLYYSII